LVTARWVRRSLVRAGSSLIQTTLTTGTGLDCHQSVTNFLAHRG
jgi:hypothetical protein